MTIPLIEQQPPRNARHERRLWHDGALYTISLGCTSCPDRALCGGLQIERALFDCLDLCCHKPQECDAVCRNRPDEFADRVREIGGFTLDNVPRAAALAAPPLPQLAPVLFHGHKRATAFAAPTICLPLYRPIEAKSGKPRYNNAAEVAEKFGVAPGSPLILTGTAVDPPLERWWSLGPRRCEAIRALRNLGVALVTTPNFSLFIDQPRWDDLHSIKRIALVHQEFLSEGVLAALHVNARTERDWERWSDYIAARPEVTHLAFEFATGAGWGGRIEWHAAQLAKLAAAVSRPLHLVVRGGGSVLPTLLSAFAKLTVLETSTFVKTVRRRRAVSTAAGRIHWRRYLTEKTESLDDLLAENWRVVEASYTRLFKQNAAPPRAA